MSETPEDRERRRLQQHLVDLRNRLHEISGGEHHFGPAGDGMGLKEEIAFLEHVIAFEAAPKTTWIQRLKEAGYDMPAPATLSDEEIGLEVWQVIQRLSELRAFLYSTDHLSDRELYEWLYQDMLRAETLSVPPDPDSACHFDVLGSGSSQDTDCWLRFYADDAERAEWKQRFPDDDLPPGEKPPYERDHLLPKRTYDTGAIEELLDRLMAPDWETPDFPVQLSSDVPHLVLMSAPIYSAARIMLEELHAMGKAKATAKLGNLPRVLVKKVFSRLPMDPEERALTERVFKVQNEEDFHLVHITRIALEDAGLIRKYKGHFSLTRKGNRLMDPSRAGEMYRAMFMGIFRKVNLGYFDGYPDLPGLQATLAIMLWRMDAVAADWTEAGDLLEETVHPDVQQDMLDALGEGRRPTAVLSTRIWRHLASFGLLEEGPAPKGPFHIAEQYKVTGIFRTFLSFKM